MTAMIYLVRHGQTIFNAEGRLQGQLDSALTPLGVLQAQRYGATLRRLTGTGPCAIVCSPLGRAVQTASLIAQALPTAPQLRLDPDWMEISMGQWDGHTNAEIEAHWPGQRAGLTPDHWHFHAPDGERFAQITARVNRGLDAARTDPSAAVIIVSHGITLRVARGVWAGLDFEQLAGLAVPQDQVFALGPAGQITNIAVDPLPAP